MEVKKIAASGTTSTELGYLSGVTSNIQTQFNGVQAQLNGKGDTISFSGSFIAAAVSAGSRNLYPSNFGITSTNWSRLYLVSIFSSHVDTYWTGIISGESFDRFRRAPFTLVTQQPFPVYGGSISVSFDDPSQVLVFSWSGISQPVTFTCQATVIGQNATPRLIHRKTAKEPTRFGLMEPKAQKRKRLDQTPSTRQASRFIPLFEARMFMTSVCAR